MLQFGNNIGNLLPNEEALCLASAFMQDKQTRIVVKRIAMKRNNSIKD